MKALTLHQPYASLILSGAKSIETRRWATRYRGPLLICAGKRFDRSARSILHPDDYPRGVVLCVAELVDCRPMTDRDWPDACCDPYPGAFAWVLGNVRRIDPSVPIRGFQKLFNPPPDVLRAVQTALHRAA